MVADEPLAPCRCVYYSDGREFEWHDELWLKTSKFVDPVPCVFKMTARERSRVLDANDTWSRVHLLEFKLQSRGLKSEVFCRNNI